MFRARASSSRRLRFGFAPLSTASPPATSSRPDEMTTEIHEVEVDGHPVRYRVTGSGEPLVLVHGLAGSWRWWSPMLEQLGARRRVHVVDLPRLRHPVRAAQ